MQLESHTLQTSSESAVHRCKFRILAGNTQPLIRLINDVRWKDRTSAQDTLFWRFAAVVNTIVGYLLAVLSGVVYHHSKDGDSNFSSNRLSSGRLFACDHCRCTDHSAESVSWYACPFQSAYWDGGAGRLPHWLRREQPRKGKLLRFTRNDLFAIRSITSYAPDGLYSFSIEWQLLFLTTKTAIV